MDDSTAKKSELMIDMIQYAHDYGLNISKKEDVQKILDELDPDHTEDIDEFFKLLQTSDMYMSLAAREIKSHKTKLPN